jgi:CRP/FNR family cyclic AMP-dependent transcriptional regulator
MATVDLETFRDIPIFQLLDNDELSELAAHIDEMNYAANQMIFKEGDPGGDMQIVLTGKVQNFILDDDKKKIVLAEVGPGEMFGELSLLSSEPRSANALALEPTRTFIIDRDDLIRLFQKKPAAALDIIEILGRRIRSTDLLLRTRVSRNPNEEIEDKLSFGDKVADGVARFGGSWNFIGAFGFVLFTWIILNTWVLHIPFDPAPYIGLNLILSMLAALQAPVIMMSQNRQDAKDRVRSELDYNVNLKAELEIMQLHEKVDQMRDLLEQRVNNQAPQIPPRTT